MKLTAAVIARDEEHHIGACLESLAFADERLVLVDAATLDRTREVARLHGARVEESAFQNFATQRQTALGLARGDWVLFVDADERVSAALRDEILGVLAHPDGKRGFWIPRHNYLFGRLMLHAGWFPDHQLRLLEACAAHFDPLRVVHELAIVDGPVDYLSQPLVHFNYPNLGEFIARQERYAGFEAQRWLATYGHPRLRALLGQPLREFWRRYVELEGFRDGPIGLLLSLLLAYYAWKAVSIACASDPSPGSRSSPGSPRAGRG